MVCQVSDLFRICYITSQALKPIIFLFCKFMGKDQLHGKRISSQISSLLHTSFSSTFTATRKLACQSITAFIFCRDIVAPPTFSIAHFVLTLYYFWKKFRANGQKIRRSIKINCCNLILAQNTLKNKLIFSKKPESHRLNGFQSVT